MDGVHDLGGKLGYGAIDVDESDVVFHHAWEGREWGISRCARVPGCTIDWWRHVRELIKPEDYLNRPYFDSWAQTDLAAYLNAGIFAMDEVISGKAEAGHYMAEEAPPVMDKDAVLAQDRKNAFRFDGKVESEPQFSIGDTVFTSSIGHDHHTRLPQYVRGKRGVVQCHHGAHIFPDLSAQGIETHQHLYSIVFEAAELWPEAKGRCDRVYLDLWESYLSGSDANE
ncbi:MAG: nitrile hydratase [marine bacterium B5-7]|nr:MAG: nitrile hydratase [marine bacterium B5-7]